MGVVYRAERADGAVKQEAAVKVLQRMHIDDAGVRRFAQERDIVAQLGHPGIARLFDAGTTREGSPYYAMRFAKATAECSVTIARVEFVENAQIGRPVMAATTGIVVFVLLRGFGANRVGNFDQLFPGRFQLELDVCGINQVLHQHKGIARAFADSKQAVIVHEALNCF